MLSDHHSSQNSTDCYTQGISAFFSTKLSCGNLKNLMSSSTRKLLSLQVVAGTQKNHRLILHRRKPVHELQCNFYSQTRNRLCSHPTLNKKMTLCSPDGFLSAGFAIFADDQPIRSACPLLAMVPQTAISISAEGVKAGTAYNMCFLLDIQCSDVARTPTIHVGQP